MGFKWITFVVIHIVLTAHNGISGIEWDKDRLHPKPIRAKEVDNNNDWINPPGSREKTDWYEIGQAKIQDALKRAQRMSELHKPAKNVILIVGDGMGITTTSAARIFMSQQRNLTGEDAQLSWERMPYSAFSKTYSTIMQVTDSSAGATAMLCGEKTWSGMVSVNQDTIYSNCSSQVGKELKCILQHSIDEGKWTGVVSNTRITHGTPACAYAHAANREWESRAPRRAGDNCTDIAAQLIDTDINQKIRVILGGGRETLTSTKDEDREYPGSFGKRRDNRNLINEWLSIKRADGLGEHEFQYVDNLQDFEDISIDDIQYLMGLFQPGHMQYEHDREGDKFGEPSLSEMVAKSIEILQKSSQGYFLFVESGRIDTAHHNNKAQIAMTETVEMSDAVQVALDMTSEEDTLIVVSADHSHVFSMAGYSRSETDILTFDENNDDEYGKMYGSLGYTNGPGYEEHRMDENGNDIPRKDLKGREQEMTDINYRQDAGIKKSSDSHAGEDVAIYARGPMAHLFQGTHEQSYIGNAMMYASCVGKNKDLCEPDASGIC